MLIDWLTVVAQIFNFLVLVGLMRHFLYKPLLNAIDAREEHVAGQLAEADRKLTEADRKTADVAAQLAGLEDRGAKMIDDARKEAAREKSELLQTGRESIDAMEARWREDLRREEAAFIGEIRREAAAEVFSIARRALADLAGADIDHSVVETFLAKLGSIETAEWKTLCREGLTVVTATELPTAARTRIQQAIESRAGGPVDLRFERAPEMAWGIELRGDGQRIGWTPENYVDSLEEKLRGVVNARV